MGKFCEVTGSGLLLGAVLALSACTAPAYSGDRDAAAKTPTDTGTSRAPRDGDETDGTRAPRRDASVVGPTDTEGEGPPSPDGDPERDAGAPPTSGPTRADRDAGGSVTTVASEPLPDAGMTTSGTALPSWAPKLPGRYAVVVYSFTEDGLVRSNARDLGLMEVLPGANGYEALWSACQSYGISAGGTSSATVLKPASLPPRRFQLVLGADTFVARPIDVAVGYEQTQPPSCDGHLGEQVEKRAFQTWISGSKCRCSDEAPPKVDDCRVVDPDGDKRPGFTVQFRTLSATNDIYGVIESRSSMVQGHVADNGAHTALYQVNDVVAQFGCDPSNCGDVGGVSMTCDTIYNQVLFAPLDRVVMPAGGWSCASIIDLFPTLFPMPAPTFPAHCRAK